jgi:acyl-CoA synthetase (AMP-forming)/AMP-acid ligase II
MERFAEAFAPYGFRREAFYPCYGLAEASLYVTGGRHDRPPVHLDLDAAALRADRVEPALAGDRNTQRLVGCGRGWLDQRVIIVDPKACVPLGADRVGEIWLQGSNVTRVYRELPAGEADPFGARLADGDGPWLRTGDLGFVHEGELFVTGRCKDVLIQHGQNYYPQDLEWVAGRSHAFFRVGCNAAFTVDEGEGERVVIVQEVHRRHSEALEQHGPQGAALRTTLVRSLRAEIVRAFGVHVWRVALLRHGTIPKTSSGKIQRGRCRRLWRRHGLDEVHPPDRRSKSDPSQTSAASPR